MGTERLETALMSRKLEDATKEGRAATETKTG